MAAYLEQAPVLRLDKGCDPGDLKPVAPGVFLPLRRDRNNRNTPYPRFPVRALKHAVLHNPAKIPHGPYRTGAGDSKAEPGLHRQRGQVGGHRESGNLCGRQFL